NIKSLSKTVLSAIVGIAIDRGVFASVDQPITAVLDVPEDASARIREITIGHLLSMQAGLQRTSGRYYGEWVSSDNWVDYVLSRPFVAEPGAEMLYSTGSYHLLSAALTETTGRSTLAITRDWLGEPLDIKIRPWLKDPQGVYFGGNNMHLSPMALLKIGELYRNEGVYGGKQLLSPEWIEQSWTQRGNSRYTDDRYGYGWFVTDLAGHRAYYGRGYGGQMLYVVPDLEMTVVMTSDPQPPASPSFMQKQNALLEDFVIPAFPLAPASSPQNSQAQR
ncbi:MAG TPA: serine hydrolase, partial [Marinobacter sp.]